MNAERFGPFVLGRQLGSGGMGSVWLARHAETGGEYALKLLPLSAEPELLARLRREGVAMARLEAHPNLVRVHALLEGSTQLGLVLELCRGGDLAERLRGGPLAPAEVLELGRGLAAGLALAHAAGVLHRDLKPANVMFDEQGRPKLTDFGLAKLSGAAGLTGTGELLGTPAYMAPEQALSRACDERTDVYGLCAILYHCLSGGPPFTSATILALLDAVVRLPPGPLPGSTPPGLARAVLRGLAKDPGQRYATVEEFARALDPSRSDPGGGSRVARWLGGLSALLLVAAGAVVGTRPLWTNSVAAPSPTSTLTSTRTPSPRATRALPSGSPAQPGLLPWPKLQPPEPAEAERVALQREVLRGLSGREGLVALQGLGRGLRWPELDSASLRAAASPPPESLALPRLGPLSLLAWVRIAEAEPDDLAGIERFLAGGVPGDGAAPDPRGLERLRLGLVRGGDRSPLSALEACYREERERGAALACEQLRSESEAERALGWSALGARAERLGRDRGETRGRTALRLDWSQAHRLHQLLLGSLSAPSLIWTRRLTLPIPDPDAPDAQDPTRGLVDWRSHSKSALRGDRLELSGFVADALRTATPGSYERTAALALALALGSWETASGDTAADAALAAALASALSGAGERELGRSLTSSGDGLPRAELRARFAAAGLLGTPPRLDPIPPLGPLPTPGSSGVSARDVVRRFYPHAPLLQVFAREASLLSADPARLGRQAREFARLAEPSPGLSAVALAREFLAIDSLCPDPILGQRLLLHLYAAGRQGVWYPLREALARSPRADRARLVDACDAVGRQVEEQYGVHAETYQLPLPRLGAAAGWEVLRAYEAELAQEPFATASVRRGPPPELGVELGLRLLASRYQGVAEILSESERILAAHPDATGEALAKLARVPSSDEGASAPIQAQGYLVAAAHRGQALVLPTLARGRAVHNGPLARGLLQVALSCGRSERLWLAVAQVYRGAGPDSVADAIRRLAQGSEDPADWAVFYREREHVWLEAGIPACPELGVWGGEVR